jgi:hypothetical protein
VNTDAGVHCVMHIISPRGSCPVQEQTVQEAVGCSVMVSKHTHIILHILNNIEC